MKDEFFKFTWSNNEFEKKEVGKIRSCGFDERSRDVSFGEEGIIQGESVCNLGFCDKANVFNEKIRVWEVTPSTVTVFRFGHSFNIIWDILKNGDKLKVLKSFSDKSISSKFGSNVVEKITASSLSDSTSLAGTSGFFGRQTLSSAQRL